MLMQEIYGPDLGAPVLLLQYYSSADAVLQNIFENIHTIESVPHCPVLIDSRHLNPLFIFHIFGFFEQVYLE